MTGPLLRVVLDSGILATGALGGHGVTSQVLQAWLSGRYQLIVSQPILDELRRTLDRPYFRRRADVSDVAEILRRIGQGSLLVDAAPLPEPTASHAADDLILSAADVGKADYLVTGDAELRKLGRYRGVRIVTPREFLDVLAAQRPDESGR